MAQAEPEATAIPADGDPGGVAGGPRRRAGGLLGRVGWALGARVAAALLGLATTIATARLLDPSGQGTFVLAVLAGTIAATLTRSTSFSIAHLLGRSRREGTAADGIRADGASAAAALALALAVPAAVLTVLASGDLRATAIVVAISAVAGAALADSLGVALAEDRASLWAAAVAAPPACGLAALAVAAAVTRDPDVLAIAWALGGLAMALALAARAAEALPGRPGRRGVRGHLRFGLAATSIALVHLVNARLDLLLVEAFADREDVGRYSVALSLSESVWFLGSALAIACYGRIGRLPPAESARATALLTRVTLLASAIAGGVLAGIAGVLVPLLFGDDYGAIVDSLRLLLPGVVASSALGVVVVYFVNHLGRPRLGLAVTLLSTLATVVAGLLLVPPFGTAGAAVASTAGYAVALAVSLALYLRASGLTAREALVPRRSDLRDLAAAMGDGGAPAP